MSHGARNWPFFTLIARPVSPAASSRSVWRHRKAGICSTSTACAADRALIWRMDIGQHRQAGRLANVAEDGKTGVHADPAGGRGAGAVRLVVAGLVDDRHAGAGGYLAQSMGDLQRVGSRLRSGKGRRSGRMAGRCRSRCRRRERYASVRGSMRDKILPRSSTLCPGPSSARSSTRRCVIAVRKPDRDRTEIGDARSRAEMPHLWYFL